MKSHWTLMFCAALAASSALSACAQPEAPSKVEQVAAFKGVQVTGVTVSDTGRVFANFPRWREGVPFSVVEVMKDGSHKAYPDAEFNIWKVGDTAQDNEFMAVQSVVADKDFLYVLDTRNPVFTGVLDAPRLFVFDLRTNQLSRVFKLSKGSYHKNSYINDLRVDHKNGKIYMTDSGHAGLVVLDSNTGENFRILNDHYSTSAEKDYLVINGKRWNNTVHSDGIALNKETNKLYYHSLTGHNLYAIDTAELTPNNPNLIDKITLVARTAAPDGMIFDDKGNLYYGDLEHNRIDYLTRKAKS